MPELARDVIVVGASAGGVEALRVLMASLPEDLPAVVLVVLHMPAGGTSALPAILARAGRLPVLAGYDGAPLRHGQVYTAPADYHLLLDDGRLALSKGPSENGHRPAVNALFRSAARAVGPRCVGVVLSGTLDDGATGLSSIVARGGVAVAQDPADALFPGMPEAALREVSSCRAVRAAELGSVLSELVRSTVTLVHLPALGPVATAEAELTQKGEWEAGYEMGKMGTQSGFSCPDCQGSLLALNGTNRYRCRVGHAWSADALLQRKDEELERALWTALRTLDERTSLANRMRKRAIERNNWMLADRYQNSAQESEQAAVTLRSFLRDELSLGGAGD